MSEEKTIEQRVEELEKKLECIEKVLQEKATLEDIRRLISQKG